MKRNMAFLAETVMDAYDSIIRYDTKNSVFHYLRSEDPNIPVGVDIPVDLYQRLHEELINIHLEDKYLYFSNLSMEAVMDRCAEKYCGTLFSYREWKETHYRWYRITLMVPQRYSDNYPYIMLCKQAIKDEEAAQMETLETYGRKVLKVVKCNLSKNTARVIRARGVEEALQRSYGYIHDLSKEWLEEEGIVHPDDVSVFVHYIEHEVIQDHFDAGNTELSFFYRRKYGGFYHWVRAIIIRATEYTERNHIYTYIIEDIDTVLTNLLERRHTIVVQGDDDVEAERQDRYYQNLRIILSYFTQHFIDFYMIDLKNDSYIMYKIKPINVNGNMPSVGSYSNEFLPYLETIIDSDQYHQMLHQFTIPFLREEMKDRTSLEIRCVDKNGAEILVTYTKVASEHGTPTTVIVSALPDETTGRLKVKTFGNFEVYDAEGQPLKFTKRQSKQLLAYLIDRQGYPVSPHEIAADVLEKPQSDLNAIKYVSTLARKAMDDLERAGYQGVIIKEWNSLRVDTDKLDCDYYHLLNGNVAYMRAYRNEYMKEYSWAEETNSEILHYSSI